MKFFISPPLIQNKFTNKVTYCGLQPKNMILSKIREEKKWDVVQ
jgi:hypothetical protein